MDDILKQINAGEVSGVQFKERILDKYDIACELVAFSNSHGGKLVVGIKDKTGEINALSYSEVQETKIANKQNWQVWKSFTTKTIETKGSLILLLPVALSYFFN